MAAIASIRNIDIKLRADTEHLLFSLVTVRSSPKKKFKSVQCTLFTILSQKKLLWCSTKNDNYKYINQQTKGKVKIQIIQNTNH